MNKGTNHTNITIKKISKSLKGKIPWNKGRKGLQVAWNKGKTGIYSKEVIKKLSKAATGNKNMLGKHHTKEVKRKISEKKKGILKTKEERLKNSTAHAGSKSYRWKGGITPENLKIRNSIQTRLWREAVFARDNWTCQKCAGRGIYLHSHHILNFSEYLKLRFAIDNGITFCKSCHSTFHKMYSYRNNTMKQVKDFIGGKHG